MFLRQSGTGNYAGDCGEINENLLAFWHFSPASLLYPLVCHYYCQRQPLWCTRRQKSCPRQTRPQSAKRLSEKNSRSFCAEMLCCGPTTLIGARQIIHGHLDEKAPKVTIGGNQSTGVSWRVLTISFNGSHAEKLNFFHFPAQVQSHHQVSFLPVDSIFLNTPALRANVVLPELGKKVRFL